MKKGNQFYLKVQLCDENDNLINILSISKVQFNIGNLTKVFDHSNEEVEYDDESQAFKIWITEKESFNFKNQTNIDARVLYKNDIIDGSMIKQIYFHNSLNEVLLNDSSQDN